jgi:hypothetical protein
VKTFAYHHLICIIFSHMSASHFVCIEVLNKLSGARIIETFERNLKPTNAKDCSGSKRIQNAHCPSVKYVEGHVIATWPDTRQ